MWTDGCLFGFRTLEAVRINEFFKRSMPSQLYGWLTDASKHRHSGFAEGGAIFCCLPSLVGTIVLEMTTSTTHPRTKSELCISTNRLRLHPHEFWHTILPSHWFQWMALIEWLPLSSDGPIVATTTAQRKPANARTISQKCFQSLAGCRMSEIEWMAV